jgi:hypothetical protein
MGLWTALIRVAQAHSSAAPSKEVEAALDDYQARLDVWREWLDRSLDFWAGAWLSSRPEPTCSTEAQTRGAALGKKIWLLATRPPDQRSDESISDISIRLTAERDSLDRCSVDTPLDTVTLALLRRRLAAYEEGLAGLKADDDPRIRSAMETEQRLVARAMRCRQEHERGSPSADCSP